MEHNFGEWILAKAAAGDRRARPMVSLFGKDAEKLGYTVARMAAMNPHGVKAELLREFKRA